MTEALKASEFLRGRLVFISAGLGVVPSEARIPAYNLTGTEGFPDSVGNRLPKPFDARKWWHNLNRGREASHSLGDLLSDYGKTLILIALPRGYLHMISNDLLASTASVRRNLRIIGPRRLDDVPSQLRDQWMPYDARLDNLKSGFSGTASDFPQRALHHFAVRVVAKYPIKTASEHARLVEATLAGLKPYVRSRGATATDLEVTAVLRQLWSKHEGRRTAILRDLRHNSGIACEQSRFRRLADKYEKSLNAAN